MASIHVMPNATQTKADQRNAQEGQQALPGHTLPVDGKANQALVKWLVTELNIAQRDITLVHGPTSQRTQRRIESSVVAVAGWKRLIPAL